MSEETPTLSQPSRMAEMASLGAEWWNDSCAFAELREAVAKGATGATSNPVIVSDTIRNDPDFWIERIDRLASENPDLDKVRLTWKLIEDIVIEASAILLPVYEKTKGQRGILNVQIDPTLHEQMQPMVEQAQRLSKLGPNIAIKIPATEAGIEAAEELAAIGVRVNTTVSFTLPQAVAAAEAIQRGIQRAEADGLDTQSYRAYVTLMIGRLDDFLKTLEPNSEIDPDYLNQAGIAVFKKAAKIFRENGYAATLLAAAYRNEEHWSQIIGTDVAQTIPYGWWKKFDVASSEVRVTVDESIDSEALDALQQAFPDFKAAYEADGLSPDQFASFGASVRTLKQFTEGYHGLVEFIEQRMSQAVG
ncbi:MAG: transaldolase [Symploca sp. SIO2D2]|nr:transaldolase [Symploca sp. SIO2D2]